MFLIIACEEKAKPEKECDPGYTYKESWDTCIDIDECQINNGGCEQNCKNTIGSLECSCNEPYFLSEDGKTCSDFNDCKEDSCRNHGECTDELNGFTCNCFKGYSGTNCEECAEGFELYGAECINSPSFIKWGSKDYGADISESFIIDSKGNVFVSGQTYGEFEGCEKTSGSDIFLTKFNSNMELLWTKQIGGHTYNYNSSLSIDKDDNLYMIGTASIDNLSSEDLILLKINSDNGNIIWRRQRGGSYDEWSFGIVLDNNKNIYIVAGKEFDNELDIRKLLIMKFDSDGEDLWSKEEDFYITKNSNKIALDGNDNIYIGTTIENSLEDTQSYGKQDFLIIKYDKNGNKIWNKQFGTSENDSIGAITIKNEEIYTTGYVNGVLDSITKWGRGDIFLMKLDLDGNILLNKEYYNDGYDTGTDIVISENEEIYISGFRRDNNYNEDTILKKLDKNGEIIWNKQSFAGNMLLISLKFSNEVLYGLGITYKGGYYNPFLLRFYF
jgi:hypothetical protein